MQIQDSKAEVGEMLTIPTTRFGDVQVPESQVIDLPHGLLGFPERRQFIALLHGQDSPFLWLQSLEDSALAFVIVDVALVMPNYEIDLSDDDQEDLQLKEDEPFAIYGLVTIPQGNPGGMTVNLLGPLLVNTAAIVGKQVVQSSSGYSHRQPLLSQ